MDLLRYREQRLRLQAQAPKFRELCMKCVQPEFSCYCRTIQRFDPGIQFVILIHPIEVRRRVATGRMTHLCLENSHLIMGEDYSLNTRVNELLAEPNSYSVILYPGNHSANLTSMSHAQRQELFPSGKRLTIFVIDGTWATARKTIRKSQNLLHLPRICFTPEKPSTFRVRKQPREYCYSTIEAVHHTIDLLGKSQGFNTDLREHDKLLYAFDAMVERQLQSIREAEANDGRPRYRSRRRTPSSAFVGLPDIRRS